MMKANSPIARKLTALAKLSRGCSLASQYPENTAIVFRQMNITKKINVRPMLSMSVPSPISIPTDMKNMAMNRLFRGSM